MTNTRVEHAFVDPIGPGTRRGAVALVIEGQNASLWNRTVGVRHGGCERLADVSPELDAFFCSSCHRNGRISGAWVMDMLEQHRVEADR